MAKHREIDILVRYFVKRTTTGTPVADVVYRVRNGQGREYLVCMAENGHTSCADAATDEQCMAGQHGRTCYHIGGCRAAEIARTTWLAGHDSLSGFNSREIVLAAINPPVAGASGDTTTPVVCVPDMTEHDTTVDEAVLREEVIRYRRSLATATLKELRAVNAAANNGIKAASKAVLIDMMVARFREDERSRMRGLVVVDDTTRHDDVLPPVVSLEAVSDTTTSLLKECGCGSTTIDECEGCGDVLCFLCNEALNEQWCAEQYDSRCSLCRTVTRRQARLSATLAHARATEEQMMTAPLSSSCHAFSLMR